MSRPHGRARVSRSYPESFGTCDRCGFWYNLKDLKWQFEYAGRGLYNTHFLLCDRCLDDPQPQLMARILPADPRPVLNARVEPFSYDETTYFGVEPGTPNTIGAFGPDFGSAFSTGYTGIPGVIYCEDGVTALVLEGNNPE